MRPTTISKYNTFLQLGLVGLTTAAPLIDLDLGPVLSFMQFVCLPAWPLGSLSLPLC